MSGKRPIAMTDAGFKKLVTNLGDANAMLAKIDRSVTLEAAKLDSLSELGEMESLRLQMAMDRLTKMMSTLSNILKKTSDTAQNLVQNLK